MNVPEIRRISAAETLPLRHDILRRGLPPETAVFPGDDSPSALHFGVFDGSELVGVVSIYPAPFPDDCTLGNPWQLRGMATISRVRGQGYGRCLLERCAEAATQQMADALWCNARVGAAEFYAKHGWRQSGAPFEIPTAGPHVRMWVELPRKAR